MAGAEMLDRLQGRMCRAQALLLYDTCMRRRFLAQAVHFRLALVVILLCRLGRLAAFCILLDFIRLNYATFGGAPRE